MGKSKKKESMDMEEVNEVAVNKVCLSHSLPFGYPIN